MSQQHRVVAVPSKLFEARDWLYQDNPVERMQIGEWTYVFIPNGFWWLKLADLVQEAKKGIVIVSAAQRLGISYTNLKATITEETLPKFQIITTHSEFNKDGEATFYNRTSGELDAVIRDTAYLEWQRLSDLFEIKGVQEYGQIAGYVAAIIQHIPDSEHQVHYGNVHKLKRLLAGE